MPAKKIPIRYVVNENGCHICTSHAKNKGGYAVFKNPRKPQSKLLIHRFVYSENYLNGNDIPDKLLVRHKCDTPACINPEHLELGTHLDNSNDKIQRGRLGERSGEKNGRAKLNEGLVKEIFYDNDFQAVIGKKYNVSQVLVGLIKMRKIWKEVTLSL
jgi:hypothetical protein